MNEYLNQKREREDNITNSINYDNQNETNIEEIQNEENYMNKKEANIILNDNLKKIYYDINLIKNYSDKIKEINNINENIYYIIYNKDEKIEEIILNLNLIIKNNNLNFKFIINNKIFNNIEDIKNNNNIENENKIIYEKETENENNIFIVKKIIELIKEDLIIHKYINKYIILFYDDEYDIKSIINYINEENIDCIIYNKNFNIIYNNVNLEFNNFNNIIDKIKNDFINSFNKNYKFISLNNIQILDEINQFIFDNKIILNNNEKLLWNFLNKIYVIKEPILKEDKNSINLNITETKILFNILENKNLLSEINNNNNNDGN